MTRLALAAFLFLYIIYYAECECQPDQEECVYYFSIKERLTMLHRMGFVYAKNGKLYTHFNRTQVPIDEVVSVDGVSRLVITVNETIPGPPIIVYEGQTVIVHVHNYLLSDSVTIHWHGLHQKGTPWMDGVGRITQCPIMAGQTFTYKFKASPKGTFWYHSHVGAQRSNGLFGAFIIKEKPKQNVQLPEERIMIVGDWHHESAEELHFKHLYGNFNGTHIYWLTSSHDGAMFSGVPWVSALINGKGRYLNPKTGKRNEAPLEKFVVTKGEKYRFRVIQAGMVYPLRVSVDNHNISVVATDGYDLSPVECESFIINPGERFDFIIHADQPVGNYWIRTVSLEVNVGDHSAQAILHYKGASIDEPKTTRRKCESGNRCAVINCPFKYYPSHQNTDCIILSSLKSPDESDPVPEFKSGDSEEHFLNFGFNFNFGPVIGLVNGRKFQYTGVSSLTQDDEIDNYRCDKKECGHDKVCYCHNELNIPYGKTIQLVWTNLGRGAGWGHPIHLHGHSFYVLKMGYPPQNSTSGRLINVTSGDNWFFNKDIDCLRNKRPGYGYCNEARWMNQSWKGNNIPGLNLKNPPRKDTLIIPTGGYAVVRIRSDNPGKWFLHCHAKTHALDGMAMTINEAPEISIRPPKGFPVCHNFYHDPSRDHDYVREDEKCPK